jgi:hypothetical protein
MAASPITDIKDNVIERLSKVNMNLCDSLLRGHSIKSLGQALLIERIGLFRFKLKQNHKAAGGPNFGAVYFHWAFPSVLRKSRTLAECNRTKLRPMSAILGCGKKIHVA